MTTKTIFSVALAALLLGALPAAAHHDDERRDRRIAALAHDLREATHELYCDAVERQKRNSRAYRRALWTLRGLDDRARRYARRVEKYGADSDRALREFRRVEIAFARAVERGGVLTESRRLRRDFRKVERLVGKLDTRLAARRAHRWHARHERPRDRRDEHRWGEFGWHDYYASLEWRYRY